MLVALAIVLFLILLNALYVAGEFAAVGARRSRLRRLADDGNALARRMLPVVDDAQALDRYIAVSQVGITLSSLVLGAYGQAAIAPRVSPWVTAWTGMDPLAAYSTTAVVLLLVLTAAQMVLGELVPKSIALQYPTRTALLTVLPMQWSMRVSKWAVDVLNGSGMLLMRALGIDVTGHRHVHSPDEIDLLIAESRDGGLLEAEEQVRLQRALRLGGRTAGQLMVPRERLSALDVATPYPEVLRLVAASPYSRLPVYDGTPLNLVGVLHTKDVVTAFVGRGRLNASSLLRPLVRVRADMPADRLLGFLREQRSHQAFVENAHGLVVGLVTLEDVVAELLGDVADEFKGTRRRRRPQDRR
ncbi:MAG TPA: hemolysin family protein [Vicinamibacterales bacterium]|nr:hemolysin family protein [Vicinamibacterales bacterium]HWI20715.1 hemolysin family protein [Vicinamibacterales bacterium]